MFKNVQITSFRGITELRLENLGQVNLLVGKNNCGKTTVLEALWLLMGPSQGDLAPRANFFREIRNVDEAFWKGFFHDLDTRLPVELSADCIEPEQKRSVVITPRVQAKTLSTVSKDQPGDMPPRFDVAPSTAPEAVLGIDMKYTMMTQGQSKDFAVRVLPGTTAGPQMFSIEPPGGHNERIEGVYITNSTYTSGLSERFSILQKRKEIDRLVKVLQQIEPALKSLALVDPGEIYCDVGLDMMIPVKLMGGGTVRLLSMLLAILYKSEGVVVIDEVENGFHASSMEILWKGIFSAAKEFGVQVIATTHSMECVRGFSNSFEPSLFGEEAIRLFRIERKHDDFRAVTYDHATLSASLDSNWEIR